MSNTGTSSGTCSEKLCCIPGCDNRKPAYSGNLFKVPYKKFAKGEEAKLWAEDLEKMIKGLRQDQYIVSQFQKDAVKICDAHFQESDMLCKGKRRELKVGALPSMNMPVKSIVTKVIAPRQPPKLREVIPVVQFKTFAALKKAPAPRHWSKVVQEDRISFSHKDSNLNCDQPKYQVDILNTFEINASFCGWSASLQSPVRNIHVQCMTVHQVLTEVTKLEICSGQKEVSNALNHYITKISDPHGEILIPTITRICNRSKSCMIFCRGKQCHSCKEMDQVARKNQVKKQHYVATCQNKILQSVRVGYNLPIRVKAAVDDQKSVILVQKSRIIELEKEVKHIMDDHSRFVVLDEITSDDVNVLMSEAVKKDEIDDFHKVFWTEQQKLVKSKPCARRYHPVIIKFCLSLMAKSKNAYEELRNSGVFVLPSSRTLKDYRNIYSTAPGIQKHVLQALKLKCDQLKPHERYITLSLDEMKVKEDIVYHAYRDEMIGFVDLGKNRSHASMVATKALQFYVRSVMANYSRPVAFFATKNVHASELASMFWEVVESLAGCGLKVIALVADSASSNRTLFSYLNHNKQEIPYKCDNVYDPDVPIFLISDPPHLLKTACNNVRSSKLGGSKILKYDSHFILWEHFTQVPHLFDSQELKCCKLKETHFSCQSYAKMRVVYAAQLLSHTVSQLMISRGGDAMTRSAWFAELMNTWFDLMNTRVKKSANQDIAPYYSVDDARLIWLTDTFLPELLKWHDAVKAEGGKASIRNKKFLSWQTYKGLVGTTTAIVELIKFLLNNSPTGSYVITNRINQDPLEAYFSKMRQIGRTNEMPSIKQYAEYENILVSQKVLRQEKGANVKIIDWGNNQVCDEPLPKRKKPLTKSAAGCSSWPTIEINKQ